MLSRHWAARLRYNFGKHSNRFSSRAEELNCALLGIIYLTPLLFSAMTFIVSAGVKYEPEHDKYL